MSSGWAAIIAGYCGGVVIALGGVWAYYVLRRHTR